MLQSSREKEKGYGARPMIPDELRVLIAQGESLTVEFKSDQGPLPDADLIETVVCLANGAAALC
jgi:hypothetical protein